MCVLLVCSGCRSVCVVQSASGSLRVVFYMYIYFESMVVRMVRHQVALVLWLEILQALPAYMGAWLMA